MQLQAPPQPEVKFTDEDLVIAWSTSNSQKEVLEKLGCPDYPKWKLEQKVARMRKRGIQLKRYSPKREASVYDVEKLNALIKANGG